MTARPARVVVVAATPRTGSNLVCEALTAATGERRGGHEPFAELWRQMTSGELPWRALTFKGVARRVVRRLQRRPTWRGSAARHLRRRWLRRRIGALPSGQVGADGTFSVKVMWGHYDHLMLRHRLDALVWGAPVTWLYLRRADTVRQAASWLRAIQSDVWIHGRSEPRPVEYDERRLQELVQQAEAEDARWLAYFAEHGIVPLTVEYEDLLADYESTIGRAFEFLGYAGRHIPPPALTRQADDVSDEWVARFSASRRAAS